MAKTKGKSLIGLDIGSKCIKAIELAESNSGFTIVGYAYRDLLPEQDLKEVIKELFHSAGFNTKKVVTSISGRSAIVRYISMPEMSDIELRNAIKYEASKYIPFETDEVVLDCQKMNYEIKANAGESESAGATKEMRVILVAAKRNLIDDYLSMMESIGLWPYVIDLDSFALGNAFELHEILAEGKGQGETGKNIALIDIGSSKTLLNIMSNINSYFTREITIAGNDLTDAISKKMGIDIGQAEVRKCNPGDKMEEVKESTSGLLDDLFHEIRLSFDYFEHQFEKTIDSIYISGGSSNLVGLEEAFEKDFQKKLIKWNPIEHFEIDLDKVNQAELSQRISQLTIAVGLASRLRKVY